MFEHLLSLALESIFINNILLAMFLGMCSFLGCAKNIKCPLYIVGGVLDRVVPPEESKLLAEAVNGDVVYNYIEDGSHVANNRIYKYRTQTADWLSSIILN